LNIEKIINPVETNAKFQTNRLHKAKAQINYMNPDLKKIEDYFIDFATYDEYIILMKQNRYTYETEIKAVKASKRGNDVYRNRVMKRFDEILKIPDIKCFEYKDRNKKHKTNIVYITTTLERTVSLVESWEDIGVLFNKFISSLRKKYGKIYAIRVWESHKDGYPHIHVILIFEEHEFTAIWYRGKKKTCWRIQEYREIQKHWNYGWSDIRAIDSFHGGVKYLKKHITKTIIDVDKHLKTKIKESVKKAIRTLAMLWIFSKRAFSISRGLLDLIKSMHNSNPKQPKHYVQQTLEGETLYTWILLGFFSGKILQNNVVKWSVTLSKREFYKIKNSGAFIERIS